MKIDPAKLIQSTYVELDSQMVRVSYTSQEDKDEPHIVEDPDTGEDRYIDVDQEFQSIHYYKLTEID